MAIASFPIVESVFGIYRFDVNIWHRMMKQLQMVLLVAAIFSPAFTGIALSESRFFKKYSSDFDTCGYAAAVSQAGEVRVAGSRFAPSEIPFIASIDMAGTLKRLETLSTNRGQDKLYALFADSSGSFFAAGTTVDAGSRSDLLLYKIHSGGKLLGKWRIGSSGSEVIASIARTPGGLILAGGNTTNGNRDVLLLKINPQNGKIVWKKTFGDEDASEFGYSVAATKEGGVLVAGLRENQPVLLKIDSGGNLVWGRLIETLSYVQEGLPGIAVNDDSIYIAGSAGLDHHIRAQHDTEAGIVISKISSAGSLDWSRYYHHSSSPLVVWSLAGSPNGEVIITGQIGIEAPRAMVFKINAAGAIRWKRVLNETNSAAFSSISVDDGSIISTGCVGFDILDLFTWKIDGKNGGLNRPCTRLKSVAVSNSLVSNQIAAYTPTVRNFSGVSTNISAAKKNIRIVAADGCQKQ
jgi:outer membrane protein assembly factor BamB